MGQTTQSPETIRWKKLDKVENELEKTIKEYFQQSQGTGEPSILEALPLDFSCSIVNALDETELSENERIIFAKYLAHELLNSIQPNYDGRVLR